MDAVGSLLDVAVVGAGPAGAATAIRLARAGARVALLERAPRLGAPRLCGEHLSAEGVEALDRLGLGFLAEAAPTVRRAVFVAAGGSAGPVEARFDLPRPARAVARTRLDAALAEAAAAAGADLRLGSAVTDAAREGAAWRLETPRGPVRARFVVAADGRRSPTLRLLGVRRRLERPARIGRAWTVEGLDLGPTTEVRLGRGGYVGLLSLGDGTTNVCGAFEAAVLAGGADDPAAVAERLGDRDLAARLARARAVGRPRGAAPVLARARPRDLRALARGGVAAVGDAAGTVEPFAGRGISAALLEAEAAASALLAALDGDAAALPAFARRRARERRRRDALVAPLTALARRPSAAAVVLSALRSMPAAASRLDALVAVRT